MRTSFKHAGPGVLAALILCSACGSSLKNKLVGRWNNASAQTVWHFKSDNTVQVLKKDNSVLGNGTYKVIDNETVELKWADRTDTLNVKTGASGELNVSGRGVPPFVLTPAT